MKINKYYINNYVFNMASEQILDNVFECLKDLNVITERQYSITANITNVYRCNNKDTNFSQYVEYQLKEMLKEGKYV